jgi:hypothetical protein
MAFGTSPGHPTYSGNFIPEIWAGKLIENFYDATVLAAIANTDYEGSIKAHGDTVNIRTSRSCSFSSTRANISPPLKMMLTRCSQTLA